MCRACGSTENRWSTTTNSWFCTSCGSDQLYDAFQPTQEQTERGVWTYTPFESGSASTSPRSSIATSPSTVPRPGVRRPREPHGPPGDGFASETAESEVPTLDPIVTPSSASQDGAQGRLSRRQRRSARHEQNHNAHDSRENDRPASEVGKDSSSSGEPSSLSP